ncbi:MAG: DUF1826 domain-containing protein [Chloroherpetonaceae bacterium]|nr:DUF1826 domain-containing protein [Chloroherpetonaceae bacterium]MDW8466827.1 DUF1826 domain-containing protein [Chloroherpetonaceae bacterium]
MMTETMARYPDTLPAHVCKANTFAELYGIHEPHINLAILPRPVDADIYRFLERWVETDFQQLERTMPAEECREFLESRLEKHRALDEVGWQKFIEEVDTTTQDYAAVVGVDDVKFLLAIVRDNSCEKFHRDFYHLRLLCTYYGEGTEWTPDDNVNREKLVKGTNEEIIKDFSRVYQLRPFEIAILKGEYLPENKGKGLIHRSPSILQRRGKRVLLRLDMRYD